MCKECHPPKVARFIGKTMILEPGTCDCKDCSTVEFTEPPRCLNCGHVMEVELTDDQESFDDIWIDKATKQPVRL